MHHGYLHPLPGTGGTTVPCHRPHVLMPLQTFSWYPLTNELDCVQQRTLYAART